MAAEDAKFVSTTICEDIREEADGRYSLMGVITGGIRFSSDTITDMQPVLNLAFYIECLVRRTVVLQFRLVAPDGETVIAEEQGQIPCPDDDPAWVLSPIPIGRWRVRLPMAGDYNLMGREVSGEWETLRSFPVEIDMPASSAPENIEPDRLHD